MAEMPENNWLVGVSPWIIQDGNYGDFTVGDNAAFALEFYSELGLQRTSATPLGARHIRSSHYDVVARVAYVQKDWWAIDFGTLAYSEHVPLNGLAVGDVVQGHIYLGIDPFDYFEYLSKSEHALPMIYDWRIDGIVREVSPLIPDPNRAKTLITDDSRKREDACQRTDAWHQDNDRAQSLHYVLSCSLRNGPRLPATPGESP